MRRPRVERRYHRRALQTLITTDKHVGIAVRVQDRGMASDPTGLTPAVHYFCLDMARPRVSEGELIFVIELETLLDPPRAATTALSPNCLITVRTLSKLVKDAKGTFFSTAIRRGNFAVKLPHTAPVSMSFMLWSFCKWSRHLA